MSRQTPRSKSSLKTGRKTSLRNTFILTAVGAVLVWAGIQGIKSTQSVQVTHAFANVANASAGNAGADAAVTGNKDGGFAWGDINQDGYLDLVVNTNSNSTNTRILLANTTDPNNPVFEDMTDSLCFHCGTEMRERSAVLADLNQDGYLDLVRNKSTNASDIIQIYLNRGPTEGYQFGLGATHEPNKEIGEADMHDNYLNAEGILATDYDNDGWLDLVVESHSGGIDILLNPKDGTANFVCLAPAGTGLITSANDGDYATAADVDDDGDIDIIARKSNADDFFLNNGNGTFTSREIADASNGNKGGVVFGDFDNDGDLDLYWTDSDDNQIFLHDGSQNYVETKTASTLGEPWLSAGVVPPSNGIDGCAVGDVNHDGKLDLFFTDNSGTSYLFLNQTPDGGALSFTQSNLGINVNGNGEGCGFADYDQDGDLDLYVNVNGGNQLWRNNLDQTTNGGDFLIVEPRINLGGGVWRTAVGANVMLKDCDGNIVSGLRYVPTVGGHGVDAPDEVHFGLPNGANETYIVVVRFVTENGHRMEVQQQLTPTALTSQRIVIYDTDASNYGYGACSGSTFPVEWLDVSVEMKGEDAQIKWATASESNNDFFQVERSVDGKAFVPLGKITGAGTSQTVSQYQFQDLDITSLGPEAFYYRIQQMDMDGTTSYSEVEILRLGEITTQLAVFPNPAVDQTTLRLNAHPEADLEIIQLDGRRKWSRHLPARTQSEEIEIDVNDWSAGVYVVRYISGTTLQETKLVVR